MTAPGRYPNQVVNVQAAIGGNVCYRALGPRGDP